ncbi:MAG: polysaccharide biosynthesis/export family protein, partial [Plesiomonas shigelloides]
MLWLRTLKLTGIGIIALFFSFALYAQPVDDNIKLRPGDLIFINLPGESAFENPFQITRTGNVRLPEVGEVNLLNLTLPQASDKIRQRLKSVYKDLSGFSVSIKERLLLINVMGYVRKPGNYQLPEDANVQLAVESAGGLVPGA